MNFVKIGAEKGRTFRMEVYVITLTCGQWNLTIYRK